LRCTRRKAKEGCQISLNKIVPNERRQTRKSPNVLESQTANTRKKRR
jgi:hypothetical protein